MGAAPGGRNLNGKVWRRPDGKQSFSLGQMGVKLVGANFELSQTGRARQPGGWAWGGGRYIMRSTCGGAEVQRCKGGPVLAPTDDRWAPKKVG